MTHAAPILTLVLLGAVALAAGCGGDPVASFREHSLRPLEQRVDAQRARLAALLRGSRLGSSASARAVRLAAAPLAQAGAALAGLSAPASVSKANRAYAGSVAELARAVRRFAAALGSHSTASLRRAAADVRAAVGALQQARITLDEAVAK